jgi:hypothetical protein
MLAQKYNNNRSKTAVKLVFLAAVFLFLLIPLGFVLAASVDVGLNTAANIGLPNAGGRDVKQLLVDIVKYFLTFLGLVAVIVFIYGGWLWMTSGGNQARLSDAKKVLTNAIIGLLIIIFSFVIVTWIANWAFNTLSPGNGSGGGRGPGSGIGLGASGNSAIETHYPTRDQRDVPRNTRIAITFREPILLGDIVSGTNVNAIDGHISIHPQDSDTNGAGTWLATSTADGRTFRFIQTGQYIGNPSEKMWYVVEIGSAIRKADGRPLFSIGNYSWQFEVSTQIDNTPPRIAGIIPTPGNTEPRNVVVQINFNEAVDPMSASGPTSGFNNIQVHRVGDIPALAGNFYISNVYRTVEFLTDVSCGVNSCGNTIYCLPASSTINVLVNAATLADSTSGNASSILGDGIMDMAGNSLDGNGDGKAQGPTGQSGRPPFNANDPNTDGQLYIDSHGDDYTWSFSTTAAIDATAPVITAINPNYQATGVNSSAEVSATFSKILMFSSLIKDNVTFATNPADNEVFYWLSATNIPEAAPTQTTAYLNHRDFVTNDDTSYAPVFHSGVKDIYQNCYYPSAGSVGSGCTPTTATPFCCNGYTGTACNP